ncbi:MAG: Hsp70 family protein, partial [Myxococcales bacterium]|nr:Hsp70 family protein [Myxococcales bacterium]
ATSADAPGAAASDEASPTDGRPSSDPTSARIATRIRGRGASVGRAIGIDLGTSNTCASVVEDGKPRVIPTRWGTNTVPSVLAIVDGQVRVGPAAKKRLVLNPSETVYGSKRLVGRAYSEALADEFQPYFAFPLVATDSHRFGAKLPGQVVSFEEVAERLLREVKDVAERHLDGPVDRAVITVPAYFGEAQREAIRDAAQRAGLTVGRLVAEPTAAAVAYGYGRKETATLVIFDFGGGTFDVSVLKIEGNRFEVVATGGDAFLGGIDIDDRLANHLLETFRQEEGMSKLEPDAQQIARLREAAEECKKGLSVQKKLMVSLPHFASREGRPVMLSVSVSQEELSVLVRELCERVVALTKETVEKAGLQLYSVDDVLLVGGSTRMPQVQEAVEALFRRAPSRRINPDEAVALGAALLADEAGHVELVDVLPLSVGFAGEGRRFLRLLPRNTKVPTKRSFIVKTTSDDGTYRVPIFQGERKDAAANEYLGTLSVEGIPETGAGRELELTLALDAQCFLDVSARDVSTGAALPVKVERARAVEEVVAELGPYEGPPLEPERPRPSGALGWFFARVRRFWRK